MPRDLQTATWELEMMTSNAENCTWLLFVDRDDNVKGVNLTLIGNNYDYIRNDNIFAVIVENKDYKFPDGSLKGLLHDVENNKKMRLD